MRELAAREGKPLLTAIEEFWTTYGPDFQSGAVVLSAIAAFIMIGTHRLNARRGKTLDLILHHQSDGDLVSARFEFNKIKAGTTKFVTYAEKDKADSPQFEAIRKVLNIHELTAVAVEEGVIDERVYRRWNNTTVKDDYKATRDFIERLRETRSSPNAYCEFERLAKAWSEDAGWTPEPGWVRRKATAIGRIFSA